jgi:hypothetical protein
MGLGPAVCQHCQVLATFTKKPIPVVRNSSTKTLSNWTNWYCEYCGETDPNDSAGLGDWSKYEENERFLKFVKGKDPNA